jgi:3-dehydrosphinganine reductase
MKNNFFRNKKVLITGGSSGIGLAIAKLLAREGAHLWLMARRKYLLEQALEELKSHRSSPDQRFETLCADVSQYEQVAQCINQLQHNGDLPDLLIHSAGIAQPAYVMDLNLEDARQLMEVNYLGSVYITKALLPGLLARGSGTLVFISSMTGVFSFPGYSAYGASKYAQRGFCDALRAEMRGKGIDISIVFPADTDTPQYKAEQPFRPPEVKVISKLDPVMSPEEVAQFVLKGIKRKQYLIIPGASSRFFYWFLSALGPFAYSVIDLILAWAIHQSKKEAHNS